MNLENEIEKYVGKIRSLKSILNYQTDDYIITNDKTNRKVIIMGETGCGKMVLITKVNQLLKNGEITIKKFIEV